MKAKTVKANDILSIGDLAKRTGLSISAIRFYEAKGLITPHRSNGNQRRFMRSDIRRLSFIRIGQQFGMTIDDIANELSKLPMGRTPNEKDWEKIATAISKKLDAQIKLLEQTKRRLNNCIGCGCLSLKKCMLYNPSDWAARKGTGPRYLMGDSFNDD